ncbi:MAG: hypothetical protein Q9219_006386 [cf. Caloplaca sp. 3 TL-2023]
MAGSRPSQPHRSSPTSPPLSKRDKRRNAMMDRLQEISNNFAENREYHYRRQLQGLQRDINLITYADPYQNQPMDEIPDESDEDAPANGTGMRGLQHRPAIGNGEKLPKAGKLARRYIEEVNNAMEDRDAQLSLVVERHNFRIRELKEDYLYQTIAAQKECAGLLVNLRDRLSKSVSDRRAVLLKERDKIESFDTTSLLVNPSQFSIANPASPGGPQSNRKTRHTRHRLDIEDAGSMGENKRKRRLVADVDEGSPGPINRAADTDLPIPSKDSRGKNDAYQPLATNYTFDTLFTDKELVIEQQEAAYAALQEMLSMRKKSKIFDKDSISRLEASTMKTSTNGRKSVKPNGSTNPTTANVSDVEDDANGVSPKSGGAQEESSDDVFLTAPAMDRTANSSLHVTRSMRSNHLGFQNNGSPLQTLGDLAGRASAIKLLGTYSKDRKGSDDYNRAPPLTDEEVESDLALIASVMKDSEAAPGKMNMKLVDDLCPEPIDYTNDGSVVVSDLRGSRSASTAR